VAAAQKVSGLTPNPEPNPEWVELEHEGIEGTHRVPNNEKTIKHWEARGWSVVKETPPPAPREITKEA
jgi:hypothetical protein